ncbi:hypothetical protein ACFRCI_31265 [Streptomyces sp. NPDC056638]|uniref:hypothetical protein n=1 Tax=Streptomyces sp. NPDC056638 TaxID=3345887 RepID=UPI0036B30C27
MLSAVQSIGGSIGVPVFGSVFFADARSGDFASGFRHALIAQSCLLAAFLAMTFLLPKKGRPEGEEFTAGEGADDEPRRAVA